MYQESMQADTWQTLNRVKDPDGKAYSVIFMLGTSFADCVECATWGINRIVKVNVTGRGLETEVFCRSKEEENVKKPVIMKCKNAEEMLNKAKLASTV